MRKRYFILILAVVILVGADQLVKWWALSALADGTVIDLIPGVFRFSYVENRGAAFGILQGQTVLLTVISIGVTVALLYPVSYTHLGFNRPDHASFRGSSAS